MREGEGGVGGEGQGERGVGVIIGQDTVLRIYTDWTINSRIVIVGGKICTCSIGFRGRLHTTNGSLSSTPSLPPSLFPHHTTLHLPNQAHSRRGHHHPLNQFALMNSGHHYAVYNENNNNGNTARTTYPLLLGPQSAYPQAMLELRVQPDF